MADIKLSIIFSCWTRTLDLVGKHLKKANLKYLRIDGNCRPQAREETLDEFARSSQKRILIMTTGTGAHGYVILYDSDFAFLSSPHPLFIQWDIYSVDPVT